MELWNPVTISPEINYRAAIGPLVLWLRNTLDEWHLAVERLPISEHTTDQQPFEPVEQLSDGLTWQRWIAKADAPIVRIVPAMPDLPVVVRPEAPVNIPKSGKGLFFVSIPTWLRISVGDTQRVELAEVPSVIMSHTWFGEPTSGELCYGLKSRARRTLEDDAPRPYRATCPVVLANADAKQLEFQRLCIRVAHLRVFHGEDRLWTNQVHVSSRGEESSLVTYGEAAPIGEAAGGEKIGELLSEPRAPITESLFKKSFGSIKLFGA